MLNRIFWTFAKIGGFTFGGGWAMISILEREMVDKKGWLGREEFLDLLSVAQALPGILAVNLAAIVGDKIAGRRGSIVAAVATMLPSFLIILAIAIFLTPDTIKNSHLLSSVFMGMRPCVVALILAPLIGAAKAARLTWRTFWIPVAVAAMISINRGWISNPVVYIALGILAGLILYRHRKPRKLT